MVNSGYAQRTIARWTRAAPSLAKTSAADDWLSIVERWTAQATCPSQAQLDALFTALFTAVLPASASRDEATLKADLRNIRHVVMLSLLQRQAMGKDLEEPEGVEKGLALISHLAQTCVQIALDFACQTLQARIGTLLDCEGKPQGLLVIGMGKLGAQELNPSSDIDLVFLFRDRGHSSNAMSADEFFARVTRSVSQLLSDMTEDGFVFRVDTRLRPHGDSGPFALSLTALEHYLQDEARPWERFAWLKARVVAQSAGTTQQDCDSLQALLKPFIYRRYLDYGAFAALRDVHAKIRQKASATALKRDSANLQGWDVKLGQGGIREIEFSVQLLQLLRGAKLPALQQSNTLKTIDTMIQLQAQGSQPFSLQINEALKQHYRFYRRLENALQWQEDEQTHWLSGDPAQLARLALMLGPSMNIDKLRTSIEDARLFVSTLFEELLGNSPSPKTLEEPSVKAQFAHHVQALRQHRRFIGAQAATRDAVEQLIAKAQPLEALQDPLAFGRLIAFFEAVLGRPSYFALLVQYPQALVRLGVILGKAQWAASYITKHPILLDELLDGQYLVTPNHDDWQNSLTTRLHAFDDPEDLEAQLDIVREEHHAQVFRLLCQDLLGEISLESLADELSALADAVLSACLTCLWPKVLRQFKRPLSTSMHLAVIAYGKLGGKELGYASDLDLVFIFADEHKADEELYARLVQRLGQFLTTQTSAGHLFDIDYRLRPNGQAGVSVMSLSAFERYQKDDAWLWEHQALTRARFSAGDTVLGAHFEALRNNLLAVPRALQETFQEIWAMRQKMHDGHPNRSALFDLKHDAGGMVDIEFCVQALVLGFSAKHPALLANKGNITLLGIASDLNLIEANLAKRCQDAYREYRRLQHLARLNDQTASRVERAQVSQQIAAVQELKWAVDSLDS